MGATRNLGYIENLISYDGNDNIGIGGAVNVLYKVTINGNTLASGTLNIGTVTNAGVDTDKFLVLDTNGTVRFRTGAELASDIGPAILAASTLKHVVKLGETVSKGQAVYVSSADGTNMIVSKASNASEATSSKTLGLVETNGVLNDQVNVITEGLLAGLDTSTANIGDPVWLGTSGNIIFGLANKPYAPAHLVFIGVVTRVQQNNGEIFVKVQNGFELKEIHDIQITSTPSDNQVLTYETATSLYKMKTVDGANVTGYALTKTDDTNVTLTLGGSASTSLLRAASLTLGWTGQLAISRGGTGLSALGTAGQLLRVNSGATALEYWTPTYISAAITSLNGLSGATQTFATGTSGTDFGISSSSTTHTFNLPTASATNRGALSSTDWSTFNGKQAALNGTGFVKISGTTISYDNSTYLTSYTETDTLASVTGRGASTTTAISINSASVDHVTLANRFHFIGSSNLHITNNAYYNAAFKYQTAAAANKITIQSDGNFLFDYAASGTIDTNITWTTVFSVTNAGIATASSFVKSGGTSSQILMADGSVLTAGTNITISGGTISSTGGSSLNGTGFVRMAGTTVSYITGTSSQFVKADGSLDGTGYEPTVTKGNLTSANTAHLTVTGGTGAIIGSGVNLTILPGAIVNSGLGLTTTGSSGAATFSSATLNIPNYTLAGLGGLSNDSDSEQTVGSRIHYWNVGGNRMNTDPRWNESGYDADLGALHIWATTAAGANYGRAGIALYNGSAYQYLTTKASTTGMFVNNTQIVTNSGTWSINISGSAAQLGGYSLDGATSVGTRIFNNKGQVHNTYTNFNTVMTPGPNYLQQGTNGPTGTASHQWYGFMFGLGSEYGTSTGSAGHYASQLYYARAGEGGGNYLWARDMESGSWGSWRKLHAGYADSAGSANFVSWSGISSGYRENYDIGFRPADNSGSYSGFRFASPGNDANAGYFLIRGGADSDVYTQNGLTIVADLGWLTLAQRTTAGKGVRIMTGSPGSSTRMQINSSGLLEVFGTSYAATQTSFSPSLHIRGAYYGGPRLQVYGLDADPNAWMGLGADMGAGAYQFSLYYSDTAGSSISFGRFNGGNGTRYSGYTTTAILSYNGTFTAAGDIVAYGSPSDISLKENINPIQNPLEIVSKLNGVTFTWKEDTDTSKLTRVKNDIGFIAQEVEAVIPELVRLNEDTGLLSLRDKGIIPILVEAIKEQQKQIEELKSQIKNK